MDDASQASPQPESCRAAPATGFDRAPPARPSLESDRFDHPLPAQSVHFAVPPMRTLTLRVKAPAAVRVHGAIVWITRARSPYDHWLRPGDTLRLERNERIWLSTEAATPARVTITTAWQPPFAKLRRWGERVAVRVAKLALRSSQEA
ncbi:DUF2917 domain-containing protein [Paraburkholderia acidisoli]|uniref:DUF2917 domain-containing protein n=1 Tax=Paraburkholderia acidisoli TaxID=2571748 RepID=A0A7Z2GLV5_9BURK|nr:DUF2917 domain-containing protein [Paraburkholderia acidisoli]QGZ63910.1 DUF2917 domain-containing protein [Paraburkholderia acidisoli]